MPKAPDPGRRGRKKQRTRQQIHRAAMGLFAERGYDAVTLEQICESADVARATFFLHFPSKGALLRELEAGLALDLDARLAASRASALAEYRTLVECLLRDWPARAGLRADLLAAMLRERLAAPASAGDGSGLRERACAIVRRGQQQGELRRNLPPQLAAALLLATAATLLAEGVPPEPARRALLTALLHGLADGKPRLKWTPSGAGSSRRPGPPSQIARDRS